MFELRFSIQCVIDTERTAFRLQFSIQCVSDTERTAFELHFSVQCVGDTERTAFQLELHYCNTYTGRTVFEFNSEFSVLAL